MKHNKAEIIFLGVPLVNGHISGRWPDQYRNQEFYLSRVPLAVDASYVLQGVTDDKVIMFGYAEKRLLDTPGAPVLLWDGPFTLEPKPDPTIQAPPLRTVTEGHTPGYKSPFAWLLRPVRNLVAGMVREELAKITINQ